MINKTTHKSTEKYSNTVTDRAYQLEAIKNNLPSGGAHL